MAKEDMIKTLDKFEAEFRKGIGVKIRPTPWREASLDNIRRFTEGIGDYNPLWRDEEHAKKSRFGMITAPPTFLYSLSIGARGGTLANIDPARNSHKYIVSLYAGGDFEFLRPIWLGDRLYAEEEGVDIVRKPSQKLGQICWCTGLTSWFNQRKELVATYRVVFARFQNPGKGVEYDREDKSAVGREPPDPLVYERTRRGAETRYWEDVEVGEDLPTLKKGTYTQTELLLFSCYSLEGPRSNNREEMEELGVVDFGVGGRGDKKYTQARRAMIDTHDVGAQRISWLGQIVTDWMGDDGTLKTLWGQLRNPNVVGDTNTVYGVVKNKYIKDGEHLVDVEMWNQNQAELITAPGRATVVLPSRASS